MRTALLLAALALALSACWRESVPRYDDPRVADAGTPSPDAPDADDGGP